MKPSALGIGATLLAAGFIGVPAVVPASKPSPPRFVVHDLGVEGSVWLNDLNTQNVGAGFIKVEEAGQEDEYHVAFFQDGNWIDLGTLGGDGSTAFALNDRGQVVGVSETSSGAWHTFLWSDVNLDGASNPGEMRDLGAADGVESYPYDINNRGEVVGEIYYSQFHSRAFIWKGGKMRLPLTQGSRWSSATWIGGNGTVLGTTRHRLKPSRPLRWQPGQVGKLLPMHKFPGFFADVVGQTADGTIWLNLSGDYDRYPVVFKNGRTDLAPGIRFGDPTVTVLSVNRTGRAVGTTAVFAIPDENSRAIYWHGKAIYDLNELLAPGSGLSVKTASVINDPGWIVAEALDSAGEYHQVLLEPAPQSTASQ